MRSDLEQLLRETTLRTLAFAIALGWSLFQVASGLSYFITTLLQRFSTSSSDLGSAPYLGGLSWQVGHRIVAVGQLLAGLLELAAVLAVALLVQRRYPVRRER